MVTWLWLCPRCEGPFVDHIAIRTQAHLDDALKQFKDDKFDPDDPTREYLRITITRQLKPDNATPVPFVNGSVSVVSTPGAGVPRPPSQGSMRPVNRTATSSRMGGIHGFGSTLPLYRPCLTRDAS